MIKRIRSITFIVLIITNPLSSDQRIINDPTLIIPGIGAERALVGESVLNLENIYHGDLFQISKFDEKKNILKDIFNIPTGPMIFFDTINNFVENKIIIFSFKNSITAIAGFNRGRVTIDTISLDKGIEYFIFNYGNHGLLIMNHEKGKIYVYSKIGIALFKEKNSDMIDMYLIFNCKMQSDH